MKQFKYFLNGEEITNNIAANLVSLNDYDVNPPIERNDCIEVTLYLSEAKKARKRIIELEKEWFPWYDNQISQAARAQRQGKEWSAVYVPANKHYETIKELDDDADINQLEMRRLRNELE